MLILFFTLLIGSIVLLFAMHKTHQITQLPLGSKYSNWWKFIQYFISLFVVGYLFIDTFVFLGYYKILPIDSNPVMPIVGLIFLIGSIFVYFTVRVGYGTIEDFRRTLVSKRYVNSIVNSMADTLIVIKVGSDLRISRVNQATLNLLGYIESELIDQPITIVFGTNERLKEYLKELETEKWITNKEANYYTKNGEKIPTKLSISCIRDSNDNILDLIIAAQDITQRLKSEKALKASERKYCTLSKELKESNTMKKMLLDVISHDLKNPTAVIKGFAEIGVENDPENEICQAIQDGTENLLKVIDNVTNISKVTVGDKIDKEVIDIVEIIKTITEEFTGQLQVTGMVLDLNIDRPIIINANPIISEVFRNYISNAIKYASSGKSVVIETEEENDIVTVNVIDKGKTISKVDRKNIFKRSVQLGNTSGSGLGLAIVKRIAKAHNAKVGIEPNHPTGNIFYIKIPRR